jgi:putative colanic acid biosynthesis acetyltransferase WcaF
MKKYYEEIKPKYFKRLVWIFVNKTVFRVLIGIKLFWLRNAILKSFGAKIPWRCNIYSSVNIYAPWNLEVGKFTTIGPRVNVFNKALITIGSYTTISQDSYLCTGSHKINKLDLPANNREIVVGDYCWVASNCFVGPGVTIFEGCVLSATSSLFESTKSWHVYRGNPALEIQQRIIN